MCLNAGAQGRQDAESETLIPCRGGFFDTAHTLRAEGFGASEDGTGRQNLVPVAFAQNTRDEVRLFNGDGQITGALAAEPGMKQQTYIAFSSKDSGNDAVEDISPTLRAMNHADSHPNGGGQVAVAFQKNQVGEVRTGEVAGSLNTNSNASVRNTPMAIQKTAVRRLTPRECERLQGFPDDYTLIPLTRRQRREVEQEMVDYYRRTNQELSVDAMLMLASDGPRYKALGNSWAVPNVRWIGRRIDIIDKIIG
jgi:DNA (cytosine-5)-methyltransferase 1